VVGLFKERGLRANRLLGQHFLVDHNVLDFLCRSAELSREDVVLEIGAGTGLLTQHLARSGAHIVAVEIDERLFEIAREYLDGADNALLLCTDIHGARRRMHPDVESALRRAMGPGRRLKVVSNLPYCISSDLIVSLMETAWPVERMVLTVQKEFAARLVARPGSRDYGALSVLVRGRAEVERLRTLASQVFWPVPRVGSAVVRIRPDETRAARIADVGAFRAVVKALFSGRRKTAAGALASMARPRRSRPEVEAACAEAGLPPRARADGLTVEQIIELADRFAAD